MEVDSVGTVIVDQLVRGAIMAHLEFMDKTKAEGAHSLQLGATTQWIE